MRRPSTAPIGGLAAAAALLVAFPVAVRAQQPEDPLHQWLSAFNAGDEAIRAFYGRHLDDPDALTARNLRQETCGFDLVRVENADTRGVSALLAERCFPALQKLTIARAEDGTIADLKLVPFAMEGQMLDAAITDLADRLAAADDFAGALLIVRDGGESLSLARGSVSETDATPIGLDTPMFLASAGKMFTAVAILQLVAQGRVDLDAPLSRYLPDYPNAAMARATIRQLLSHRGGAGEDGILRREEGANRAMVRTIDDYIALNGRRDPDFVPGTKADYSNYGFILLGAVIERVSGQSFQDFVQAHVFAPAGMAQAGYPDRDHLDGIPVGITTFFESEDVAVANTDVLPWRGSAAGGGVASANDMLRFFRALKDGTLLPPDLFKLATTPGETEWYGLGFIAQAGDVPLWGHGGGSYGMSVAAQNYPSAGTSFICLAARDMACDRLIFAWYLKRFGITR